MRTSKLDAKDDESKELEFECETCLKPFHPSQIPLPKVKSDKPTRYGFKNIYLASSIFKSQIKSKLYFVSLGLKMAYLTKNINNQLLKYSYSVPVYTILNFYVRLV